MNNRCVYTAICGSIDTPKPINKPDPTWDYILFTDDKSLEAVPGWTKVVYLDNDLPPRLKAKYPKILPHKYLPEQYETSIWIDGSYEINGGIGWIYEPYKSADLAVTIHPSSRTDIYHEADEVLKYGLDTYENIQTLLQRYREEGFVGTFQRYVYQCGVLIRKHKPEINNVMEKWMDEINNGSIRDQLSFPYVLWKHFPPKVKFVKMAQKHIDVVLKYNHHNKHINNLYFLSPYGFNLKIGDRLNNEIQALPDDAWIVITDQDVAFLTEKVGDHLNAVINRYPDTDLFSCYTNRLGLSYQRLPGVDSDNYDLLYHHDLAQNRLKRYYSTTTQIDQPVAGFFMMFPKKTWERHNFQPEIINKNKQINGHQGVYFDYDFSHRILKSGGMIRLIEGLYVLHLYRLNRPIKNTNHLLRLV